MKILICCQSEAARETLRSTLQGAGHEVTAASRPSELIPKAIDAGALLVGPEQGRRSIALLRDQGFAGRTLLASDAPPADLARQAQEAGADAPLALAPRDDLARRFALAVGGKRRILVVDDSEIVSRLLRLELERAGFEVVTAPGVESALHLILKRATRPDLILLDINMPRVSGLQFCRFLKGNARFRAIKVVLCSGDYPGHATPAEAEKASALVASCGADGFVSKHDVLGSWIVNNA